MPQSGIMKSGSSNPYWAPALGAKEYSVSGQCQDAVLLLKQFGMVQFVPSLGECVSHEFKVFNYLHSGHELVNISQNFQSINLNFHIDIIYSAPGHWLHLLGK